MNININKYKKNFNFKLNKKIYNFWIKKKFFNSFYNKKKKSFYLLLPPPNITGDLHIGHILNFTLLDIIARRYRMMGYNVCWIPGTDHASIATEIKILKYLNNKGININNINKKKFNKILLNWSIKYNKIIIDQLKKIGFSCDWKRIQFTMNKNSYKSVIKIFIKLYKKGLIYKKKKIVNWDTYAKTTISDEEIIYKKKKKNLYYIKYFTEDKKNYLVIATTRPETIFGDTAVCINPYNKKYKYFIKNKKKLIVPIVNRIIPIIVDKLVKKKFGTCCIKVTPGHSKEDYKIYKKHKLKIINILNDDGTLNKNCTFFKGKNIIYVRKKIIKILEKKGFLIKKKKILSKIALSDRSNTIIENKLSNQWYLKINKFIKPTLKNIKNINFYPKNKYNNLFYKWINNIKDWNISRQLNWGHKIPVYYYKNKIIVAINKKEALKKIKKKYNLKKIDKKLIIKDNNVLDTWFSSWILPVSALNGINKPNNKDFNYYYPINILITGKDILFFWVLRMIMFSSYFLDKIPFKNVYFTGIVRDKNKKKISKSLGNYKNLYLLINKYGSDVLRISILSINHDNDFIFNNKILLNSRNFINKIWNTFKVIIKNYNIYNIKKKKKNLIIKWFENFLFYKINKLNNYLDNYKFYKSFILIKNLLKKNFCSIYLEYFKKNNNNNYFKKKTLKYFLIILKILHPYAPFITEYIYKEINKKFFLKKKYITISSWPIKNKKYNIKIINKFNNTLSFIKKIKKINFKKKKNILYIKKKYFKKIKKNIYYKLIYKFSLIKNIKIKKKITNKYLLLYNNNIKYYFLKKKINFNKKKKKKIKKKILIYKKYLLKIKNNIKNKNFLLLAPKKIIKLEKKKKKDIEKIILNLKKNLLFI
ncbi:MAG: valine--tRNA ligase [Candidatus Shikimatogenerans bostrichidophilus]|nr:MAG: valine--tRNA ligase [Candidatus Shikimatogenerans bostrichidophilus]